MQEFDLLLCSFIVKFIPFGDEGEGTLISSTLTVSSMQTDEGAFVTCSYRQLLFLLPSPDHIQ